MPKPMRGKPQKAKDAKKALFNLIRYSKPYSVTIIVALLCIVASTVLAVLAPDKMSQMTQIVTDAVLAGTGTGVISFDTEAFLKVLYTLIGMYAASALLNYVQHFLMTTVSCRIANRMRSDISGKINRMPLKYFDSHNFGDTLSRVTNDVDTISSTFTNSIGTFVSAISMLVGCLIMMFTTQWIMAFSIIGATLFGFLVIMVVMAKSQKFFTARQESLAEVNGHVEEFFAGQHIVRAYNAEGNAREEFREKNERLRKNTFRAEFLGATMQPLMGFVGNLGYVVVFVVGAALTSSLGAGAVPTIVAFMVYVRQFTSPLSQIAQTMPNIQSAAAASERVFEFLHEPELSDESGKTQHVDGVKGDVEFEHVRFGYDENKIIIHDFSATVKAGQKIAIVGPTGAGKTTIVNLLMRFYELNGGAIKVDGIPVSDITRENVHDLFGMVLQDTWLFQGTLRDNLIYGKENVTDEQLERVCKAVGLTHFVHTLPQGLDTVLNDNVAISAGQKQLITIARAMVENAPMLILDEATSSVDTRTEIQIQKAMDKLTEGRTSFVIAHRLSTIRNADMIIYMKDGDIRETGTHDELLAKNGFYAALYNSQFDRAS